MLDAWIIKRIQEIEEEKRRREEKRPTLPIPGSPEDPDQEDPNKKDPEKTPDGGNVTHIDLIDNDPKD